MNGWRDGDAGQEVVGDIEPRFGVRERGAELGDEQCDSWLWAHGA
jgi:hypothetical protein